MLKQKNSCIRRSVKRCYFLFIPLVFLPLLIALSIYAFLRPTPLQLIGGLEFLHYPLDNHYTNDAKWFLYNVPDGLWAFSFESFLFLSFINDQLWLRATMLMFGLIVMFLLECLQKNILPGTFDTADLFAILLGVTSSIILSAAINFKRERRL